MARENRYVIDPDTGCAWVRIGDEERTLREWAESGAAATIHVPDIPGWPFTTITLHGEHDQDFKFALPLYRIDAILDRPLEANADGA